MLRVLHQFHIEIVLLGVRLVKHEDGWQPSLAKDTEHAHQTRRDNSGQPMNVPANKKQV